MSDFRLREYRSGARCPYGSGVSDLATALHGAVARGEMSAWFQPQVDLATDAVVGVEALCRWTHPRLGSVPPVDFIAAAEESDLIDEIGRFMARECFRVFSEWSRDDRPIDVSVNVSPRQLVTPAFTDWFEAELARLRLVRATITIEITETHPIDDAAAVIRRLDRLRAAGSGIAIDDFGTGQSSLLQLRRLHGTELKLDRSLVQDDSASVTSMLTEVVETAHRSGIRVVAEGVETEEQRCRVVKLGCDRAQGYLLGRPMPERAMSELLATA